MKFRAKFAPAEITTQIIRLVLALLLVPACRDENSTPPKRSLDETSQTKTELYFLTAHWCQWCRVMEAQVLPTPEISNLLSERFEFATVDVDQEPGWMDMSDVPGLPTFVFFDAEGRHVLSKSGYRGVSELSVLLEASHKAILAGDINPYPTQAISTLGRETLERSEATEILKGFESQLFIAVNSNRGGFDSPIAHPRPKILLEMQRWMSSGTPPPRVGDNIQKTIDGAMRGGSPKFRAEALPDMNYTVEDLKRLSQAGETLPYWREALETLPEKDPYLGLRDIDGGFFRYAAGPGWYHPHFERLADENLAWILLLRDRGLSKEAERTFKWFREHFVAGPVVRSAQVSDPFYYRIPSDERDLAPPKIVQNHTTLALAWYAQVDPESCPILEQAIDGWPPVDLTTKGAPAPADVMGEVLIALQTCGSPKARAIADEAVNRWEKGLPMNARLHRLAAGLCAVEHERCGDALKRTAGIKLDTNFAPPLIALSRYRAVEK